MNYLKEKVARECTHCSVRIYYIIISYTRTLKLGDARVFVFFFFRRDLKTL